MSLFGWKHREMQVKKKIQQEKRQFLLAGGFALPLDHWKERRVAVCSSCLSLITKWEHLSVLTPDCLIIQFAHFRERVSPDKLLDKLEGNITTLSSFFFSSFSTAKPVMKIG